MSDRRLALMANQIAANLAAQGDERAATLTAAHIRDYWDPRMRTALMRLAPGLLSPIAAAAVAQLGAPPGGA